MYEQPSIETATRVIASLARERRADPFDAAAVPLHSEPAKPRLRVYRRLGWSDEETQKEI